MEIIIFLLLFVSIIVYINIFISCFADLLYTFMHIRRKVGKVFSLILAQNTFVVVSDKNHLEATLSDPRLQKKAKFYRYSQNWLGDGLLSSSGTKYLTRRKLLAPAFSYYNLVQYIDVFNAYGGIFLEKIKRHVGNPSVDLQEDVALCTLDIICGKNPIRHRYSQIDFFEFLLQETAMGISVEAQEHSQSTYIRNVRLMTRIMMERSTTLKYQYDFLYFFMLNYWRERKALKILHDFISDIIKKRRESLAGKSGGLRRNSTGIRPPVSFLDILLRCNVEGRPLKDSDIREEVDTLVFEGHDSTASALNFAFYSLAHNKDVQV